MNYFRLNTPTRWQAGASGDKPFCFGCADCGAREVPIAGVILSTPAVPQMLDINNVAIINRPGDKRGPRHAMFCEACMDKRCPEELQPA